MKISENTQLALEMGIGFFVMVFAMSLAIGLAFFCILLLMKFAGMGLVP